MSDHQMELLKALREHGQTIQHFAKGGIPIAPVPGAAPQAPQAAAPVANPTALGGPSEAGTGGGAATQNHGATAPMQDFLGTQSNFNATGANIQAGTNAAQLNNSYNTAQGGLNSQQGFLNALQAQNGIQNQSNVYNQFQGVANGEGPNPALAMLNQQTGNNVANQAALMASQRGGSANAGLMARQAAQQGAQLQQNAVGQGASLQAQQQLAAMNNMAGIAQNQVNQQGQASLNYNTAAQNEQNILQNANTALNTANVSNQANLNNVNASISQGNQSAANGLTGGILKGISSAASGGGMFGAEGGEMTTRGFRRAYADGGDVGTADTGESNYSAPASGAAPQIGSESAPPDEGSAFADAFTGSSGGGGGGGGGGGIMKMLPMLAAMADGGPVQPMAMTPVATVQAPMLAAPQSGAPTADAGPKSNAGKYLKGASSAAPNVGSMASGDAGAQSLEDGAAAFGAAMSKAVGSMGGDKDPNDVGGPSGNDTPSQKDSPALPGGNYTNQDVVDSAIPFKSGGRVGDKLKSGGKVPGTPRVGGAVNTLKNDTVPAMLSPGEVVIPRSIMQSGDPAGGAAKFIQALMKKKQQGKKAA